MKGKRIRSANFTPEEKFLCLNLINKYRDVLDNKKAKNAGMWKEKEEAWRKIENQFNSSNPAGIKRTKESLKKFYENRKKNKRLAAKVNSLNNSVTDHSFITSVLRLGSIVDMKNDFDNDKDESSFPEEIISRLSPISAEMNKDHLRTQVDDINPEEELHQELQSNFSVSSYGFEFQDETSQPGDYKDSISSERKYQTTTATDSLARKYEELAEIKIKCSRAQLKILMMEKESALLKLNREKEEDKRKQEEDCRKKEEYENKKRDYEMQKERDAELFNLNRQSLLLDIEMKKCQLEKLKSE